MTVFANGREISAKAQDCKVIAAFPDVCFTPPQTPATPPGVPIPYPNFGMDSDLTSGSTTVKIGGEPISLENKSHYSKCSGDEAGCAPKKGVVTSKNMGKVYAQAWSSDVKVEGKGVARFGDMATSNHGSNTGDTPPMVLIGKPGQPGFEDSLNCLVGSYDTIVAKCNERGGEAHHIIPDEYVRDGTRDELTPSDPTFPKIGDACAVCVGGKASGKSSDDRSSDVGKKIAKKAKEYAKDNGSRPLNNDRGHGYLHYFFEAKFGNDARPIGDAVTIAKEALTNCAAFEGSALDADCADKAKECIDQQYKSACDKDPQPKAKGNIRKSNDRFDEAAKRLNSEGHLKPNMMPTRHSSLT